jgi:flagellar biosynthesis protein FlhB
MADDEQDPENKTEQPSQKRLEEAFKKGNIPFSREVTSFLLLAFLAAIVAWFSPYMLKNARELLFPYIANSYDIPTDKASIGYLLRNVAFGSLGVIAIPLVGSIIVAIAASFLQNGLVLSNEPIMPKLERISPLAGIKRIFSMRSLIEFIKSILKIIIVGYVAFLAVYPEMRGLEQLPNRDTESILTFLAMLATRMTIGIAVAMFFIALLDLIYQRFQHTKSLRMSKQEVKDEYKQSEGDPVIKQRLRRLRMERARNRMMATVPKADVVITNPTHFAVALAYDQATMKAPKVVAKGQDLIALRMRELAEENDVPIVQNPPLARALYTSCELDKEIPVAHYEAVAKVISYVYQLKKKKIA